MKYIFQNLIASFLRHFGHEQPKLETVDLEVLANLELAHSFNHAVYLHVKEKSGAATSFTGSIASITERQVVVKDLKSNQIRIILLSQIKKVTFVPENVRQSMIDQKNA
jgi:hypothetical protein